MTERSPFQQKLVETLLDSNAVDFDKIGSVVAKFSAEAALNGESIVHIVNKNFLINCGWPAPPIELGREFERPVG